MRQRSTHTWDLVIHYHRCPSCGYIFESRKDYQYKWGKYQKDLVCKRCQNRFNITKSAHIRLGPLTGSPQPAEVDWEE